MDELYDRISKKTTDAATLRIENESLKVQLKRKQDKIDGLSKKEYFRHQKADQRRRRDLRFERTTRPRGKR
jgi:regulator of replication initiation timing